jgi:hypothetical protein
VERKTAVYYNFHDFFIGLIFHYPYPFKTFAFIVRILITGLWFLQINHPEDE